MIIFFFFKKKAFYPWLWQPFSGDKFQSRWLNSKFEKWSPKVIRQAKRYRLNLWQETWSKINGIFWTKNPSPPEVVCHMLYYCQITSGDIYIFFNKKNTSLLLPEALSYLTTLSFLTSNLPTHYSQNWISPKFFIFSNIFLTLLNMAALSSSIDNINLNVAFAA